MIELLQRVKNRLFTTYLYVITSIAFYPSLIFVLCFLLALLLLSFEDNETTKFLIENFPFLVINNAETARSIMSTIIGGLISLTVFSFSMVMVLLNQASSNFSPRLLPGLISDKRNQLVLGTYLGTIIYNIVVLIGIAPTGDKYTLNGFSILMGIILGVVSLGMFVFFIHTISTGIQINNILDRIFNATKNRLEILAKKERNEASKLEVDESWCEIGSKKAGYFQGVNLEGILLFAKSKEINIFIKPYKGMYLLPQMAILYADKNIDEELEKDLLDFFIFSNAYNPQDNYVLGIKQITEVGVKAMSPGINDPGTAIMTLDFITELFAKRMLISDSEVYTAEDSDFIVELSTVDFSTIMYQSLASYRQYCKHDIILMEKMILMLQYLLKQDCVDENYRDILQQQIGILEEDIDNNIENSRDLLKLKTMLNKTTK